MTQRSILISVVIPTFRRPHYLSSCINSLRRQFFIWGSFEVIVVIDGPDPDTVSLLDQMRASHPGFNLSFLVLPQNGGPAAARNMGWKAASGELIVFTDDDCLVTPSLTNYYWEAYRANPGSAFTGNVIVPVPVRPTDYQKNTSKLEVADFVTANCAIPKSVLERLDGFDQEFKQAWREDSDLHFNILEHQVNLIHVKEAVIKHPARNAVWGISIREQKKMLYDALLFKKHRLLYIKYIRANPVWTYYVIILMLLSALVMALSGRITVSGIFLCAWIMLSLRFIIKRLKGTKRTLSHITEIVITSLVIPVLSVFWTIYGSIKYRTLLL